METLEGLVLNFSTEDYTNTRTGRHCIVQKYRSDLGYKGPQYFNVLPQLLRNLNNTNVGVFIKEPDILPSTIPDETTARLEVLNTAIESNFLTYKMNQQLGQWHIEIR